MNIYDENAVSKTASHLTENQFNWMKRIFNMHSGGMDVSGIYKDINDEKFLNECLTGVNTLKERYKDGISDLPHQPDYTEDPVEVTDEDAVSLIKEYGEISHSLELSGRITKTFNHTYEISSETLSELDEDEVYQMGECELEEKFGWDSYDVDDQYRDDMEVDVDDIITTLKVVLPIPEFFAAPTSEKETEESKPPLRLVADNA
jgi:hypothetical protein